jgi:hypothetical protein
MKLSSVLACTALLCINFAYSVYNTNSVYNGGWSRPMRCGKRFYRQKIFYDETGPEGTITTGHARRLKSHFQSCYRYGRWYEQPVINTKQRR